MPGDLDKSLVKFPVISTFFDFFLVQDGAPSDI